MPERETGKGPDNFWNLGNSNFFVIECKNEATTDFISKDDCGQWSVSLNWAENKYGSDSIFTGIMIHRSNAFNFDAIPDKRVRIIQECNIKKAEQTAMLVLLFDIMGFGIVGGYLSKLYVTLPHMSI